jgi:hypothetical protein
MDPAKVAQMVNVLNGLTTRNALCLLVGCMLTVLDGAPSDEERQQSLHGFIDLLKRVPVGSTRPPSEPEHEGEPRGDVFPI